MSFETIWHEWNSEIKHQAINFGADPNLRSLIFQRIHEVEKEINDLDPQMADPIDYIRHAQALHAQKRELYDLFNLLQTIRNSAMTPQQKDQHHG